MLIKRFGQNLPIQYEKISQVCMYRAKYHFVEMIADGYAISLTNLIFFFAELPN